jgi:hypothetical protein
MRWLLCASFSLSLGHACVHTMQAAIVDASKAAGMPVRSGAPGYQMHTFFRIAVRDPALTRKLIDTWQV